MKFFLSLATLATTCAALAQDTSEAILSYAGSISGYASGTVGWTFQTTNAFTVTDLGCFAKVFEDDAAITSVQVGLWNDSGVLLASNTITPASTLFNQTRYQPVTPVRYDPGTYHLGVYYSGSGMGIDVAAPTTGGSVSASPGYQVTGIAIAPNGGFAFPPTVAGTGGAIYAGPNFQFESLSRNPPTVTNLVNGIPYTNSLPAYSLQYIVVHVPPWATRATNVLEFVHQFRTTNLEPVTILFNQTNFPALTDRALIGPLVSAGTATLSTNGTPPLVPGQTYYLALTNPNPVAVTFGFGVWFDITTFASLVHGIPYTNSLLANSVYYFAVRVPPWATRATNVLEFAHQFGTANLEPVTVLFNQTSFPTLADPAIIGPFVSAGTANLTTKGTPPLAPGQTYYLALTNPNPVDVTFGLGVWFDITTLANCELLVSNVVGVADIPRYFQFDVPTSGTDVLQSVSFWLAGAPCGVRVVLSDHLPLPDLTNFEYISQGPCANDLIVMFVTNSTPAARWYVGVFNSAPTNATFSIQACAAPLPPVIILLTNGIPFVVTSTTDSNAAAPGPPQRLFFDFLITNSVPGVLFELYNLSGNADLVLQRDVPPTMTPYLDTSFFTGTTPEQIVLRTNSGLPASYYVADLRGHWYLGLYNNEQNNVAYTIRAVLPGTNGLLVSGQPFLLSLTPPAPPRGLVLTWNSVVGERYLVQSTSSLAAPATWDYLASIVATGMVTSFEVLPVPTGSSFYRIAQGSPSGPPRLSIRYSTNNQVRLSWSAVFPGYSLQTKSSISGAWSGTGPTNSVVGNIFEAFDLIGPGPKYYRLIK